MKATGIAPTRRGDLLPATLLLAALAAYIAAVYAVIVVGLGKATGAGTNNDALTIGATAIVAVTFARIRALFQRLVNRALLGKRATPYEILSGFSQRVTQTYASGDVLTRLSRIVADGIGAATTEVWLRVGSELSCASHFPDEEPDDRRVRIRGDELPALPGGHVAAVRHHGELLGAITATKRGGEPLTAIETRLIDDVASQAGLVLRNVRLTTELAAHVQMISAQAEELRASRRRIVAAHDAERRRLERDIHDGAQQHLVALAVKARLAATMVERQPDRLEEMLGELRQVTREALETLSSLSRGIYPARLTESGIAAALAAHTDAGSFALEIVAAGVERYPPEIEATVYFVCLEALQNAAKYSGAARVAITLTPTPRGLAFSVTDDGRGFDVRRVARGAGLDNIADRIATSKGTFNIVSEPGRGTTVSGEIPAVAERA